MSIKHIAAAIEHKYGPVCATAPNVKTGSLGVTKWREDEAGVPQPSDEQLRQDVKDYIDNVLPQKQAEWLQREDLESERHTALELIARLGNDLDKSPSIQLSPKTKALLNKLKAKLRS